MEGSIKPVAAVPPVPSRSDAVPLGAARTELPPEATVRPVGDGEAVRFERQGAAEARARLDEALRAVIERNIEIDSKTREVVYQVVDERTGEVTRQVPDETLLRLRTYAREMREADEARRKDDGSRVHKTA
jgi:uncharacterized FlaG/YvyC family protein